MSLSPIGSAVFELLSHKHTYIQTDILLLYSKDKYKLFVLFLTIKTRNICAVIWIGQTFFKKNYAFVINLCC